MGAARRRPRTAPALSKQPTTADLALVRQLYDLGDLKDGAERRGLYRIATELKRAGSAVPPAEDLEQRRQEARQALGVLL